MTMFLLASSGWAHFSSFAPKGRDEPTWPRLEPRPTRRLGPWPQPPLRAPVPIPAAVAAFRYPSRAPFVCVCVGPPHSVRRPAAQSAALETRARDFQASRSVPVALLREVPGAAAEDAVVDNGGSTEAATGL